MEFVEQCLAGVDRQAGLVVDPFMGCGTTLVASRNLGFRAVGVDRHPIFYTLAAAKLGTHSADRVESIRAALKEDGPPAMWGENAKKYLEKLFPKSELRAIATASQTLKFFEQGSKPLATLVFLRACELACVAQTDGIYKAPTTKKRAIPFEDALNRVTEELLADITSDWYKSHWSHQLQPTLLHKSSTSLPELASNSVVACITSPPYLNNFDYGEMTRMQLYLLGWAGSWREISDTVRDDLITNTTTALRTKKSTEYQSERRDAVPKSLHDELDKSVAKLVAERKARAGKKDYDYLVFPYYAEISKVIAELHRSMLPGAKIDWVVADAALYGVHLKTHLHTAEIMREAGFADVTVTKMRNRGTRWVLGKRTGAEEGLGEFHIRATKGAPLC